MIEVAEQSDIHNSSIVNHQYSIFIFWLGCIRVMELTLGRKQ